MENLKKLFRRRNNSSDSSSHVASSDTNAGAYSDVVLLDECLLECLERVVPQGAPQGAPQGPLLLPDVSEGVYRSLDTMLQAGREQVLAVYAMVLKKSCLLVKNGARHSDPDSILMAFSTVLQHRLDAERKLPSTDEQSNRSSKKSNRSQRQSFVSTTDHLGDSFHELLHLFASAMELEDQHNGFGQEGHHFVSDDASSFSSSSNNRTSHQSNPAFPSVQHDSSPPPPPQPAPSPFMLHRAVYRNSEDEVMAILQQQTDINVDEVDLHGNTPLHLAVKFGNIVIVHLLLEHGADPKKKDATGWNSLDEAVCVADEEIVTAVYVAMQQRAWKKWQTKKGAIIDALEKLPDFHLELKWEFDSMVMPFVNSLAPSDVYQIWKKKSSLRIDTTLVGFDNFKCIRGNASLLFMGSGTDSPGDVFIVDRDERTLVDAMQKLKDPRPDEVRDEVDILMRSDLVQGKFGAKNLTFSPSKTLLGSLKTENIGRWKHCRVFEASGNLNAKLMRKKVDRTNPHPSIHSVKQKDGYFPRKNHRPPPDLPPYEDYFDCSNVSVTTIDTSNRHENTSTSTSNPSSHPSIFRSGSTNAPTPSHPISSSSLSDPSSRKVKTTEFKRKMKASVWLTDEFPLLVNNLLPVFDILTQVSSNKYITKVKEILTLKFPPGLFPVKISVPLMLSVHALATFDKFEILNDISDDIFLVPSDFRPKSLVEEDIED
mmetsp:Transcript_44404/g.72291  ORF Transcript_44404/g.72291 Transcript_44404/m.72291 type:complete len:711 (+) Transcript_44404:125-2257(+)